MDRLLSVSRLLFAADLIISLASDVASKLGHCWGGDQKFGFGTVPADVETLRQPPTRNGFLSVRTRTSQRSSISAPCGTATATRRLPKPVRALRIPISLRVKSSHRVFCRVGISDACHDIQRAILESAYRRQ